MQRRAHAAPESFTAQAPAHLGLLFGVAVGLAVGGGGGDEARQLPAAGS
jgi:hypothetical protein